VDPVVPARALRHCNLQEHASGDRPRETDSFPHVQELYGVAPNVRAQVGVAHRHLDRGMTQELLDTLDGRASHDEVRGERMTKRMPRHVPKAGVF
jgi:hypothetical protein